MWVHGVDWSTTHLDIEDRIDRKRAADAIAQRCPAFCAFGNIAALIFHPAVESVVAVNLAKGRHAGQVASVTTTRDRMDRLYDWDELPSGLTRERVLAMIDSFYGRHRFAGPFGFRGPAAPGIPDHLTEIDASTGIRTVQLIAPGFRCPSNRLIDDALRACGMGSDCLAATSANISSRTTGHDEPAHYRIVAPDGVKADFGRKAPGFVMVGYRSGWHESWVRRSYVAHRPNSTTILDFTRVGRSRETGRTSIRLLRHGSLSDERTRSVLRDIDLDLQIDGAARAGLPERNYRRTLLRRLEEIVAAAGVLPSQWVRGRG